MGNLSEGTEMKMT